MAKLSLNVGTSAQRVMVFIQDSTLTTGAGKTGLTNASSGLKWYYAREDDGNAGGTAVSASTATKGSYTAGGFIEKDATNMPGIYEIGIPNSALQTGSKYSTHMLHGATGMAPVLLEIELTQVNNQDSVRYGMTALPNAAAQGANGLPTAGTGAFQISTSAGMVLVQRGSAAGQLDATSGIVAANMLQTLNVTIPASAGYVAVDWGTLVNKTTTNALTGTTISTTQIISAVNGSVGSVTGITASDVGAIKTQTDKMVFTVANQINSNILYVNSTKVSGDGSPGNTWGPV